MKPFNFLLVATVDRFGYPPGVDPDRFRLIAPYNNNPDTWNTLEWRNHYDPLGPTYGITTDQDAPPEPDLALVKSYGDVLRDYRVHPEHKFNGPDGQTCGRATHGLLQRRTVRVAGHPQLIGKEANNIDNVQAGLHAQISEVQNQYDNPNDDLFHQLIMPVLDGIPGRQLGQLMNCDRRTIDRIRATQVPQNDLREAMANFALELATDQLGIDIPTNALDHPAFARRVLTAWRDMHSPRPERPGTTPLRLDAPT